MSAPARADTTRAVTLCRLCLRLDVVEAAGRGSSTLLSGVLFALLFASIVAGIAEEQPTLLFALLGLFALLDAFGDVATALLDPRDLPLLRTLPIEAGAYVRARLRALALPVVVKTLALGVPVVAAKLAHGGGLRAALAFLVAFAAMNVAFSMAAVLVLLALRRLRPGLALHVALAWMRALLLVAATAGWLLLLRQPPGEAAHTALADLAGLPTAWFSELAAVLSGAGAGHPARIGGALALLAVGAVGLALVASNYVQLLEGLESAGSLRIGRPPLWRRTFERFFVAPEERATFRLGVALLRRERTFRLQTLPLLAYPLLFLALGRGNDDGGLFALLFAQLPAVVLALACLFLRFSDSPAGGFVLRFHGRGRGRELESGGRKALWYAVALPLSIAVTALLVWDRGVRFGGAVGAVGLLASTFAVVATRPRSPELPFVAPFRGRLESAEGGAIFGLLFLVIALAIGAWMGIRRGPVALLAVSGIGLVGTAWMLRRRSRPGVAEASESGVPEVVEVAASPAARFEVRLRRELRGLAVFFALAGAALTAFFAWI